MGNKKARVAQCKNEQRGLFIYLGLTAD